VTRPGDLDSEAKLYVRRSLATTLLASGPLLAPWTPSVGTIQIGASDEWVGAGRSGPNRPAHHPLWNGARRASTRLVRSSDRRMRMQECIHVTEVRPRAPVLPKLQRTSRSAVDPHGSSTTSLGTGAVLSQPPAAVSDLKL